LAACGDPIALRAQADVQEFADLRLVVDHQDARGRDAAVISAHRVDIGCGRFDAVAG
jgi:hypothetical protein